MYKVSLIRTLLYNCPVSYEGVHTLGLSAGSTLPQRLPSAQEVKGITGGGRRPQGAWVAVEFLPWPLPTSYAPQRPQL